MDIYSLSDIFIENGIVLRAIPHRIREIYDTRHADKFPNGEIRFLEEYKRDMLVVERVPKCAGKFLIECARHTDNMVRFSGRFFDSIDDAIASVF